MPKCTALLLSFTGFPHTMQFYNNAATLPNSNSRHYRPHLNYTNLSTTSRVHCHLLVAFYVYCLPMRFQRASLHCDRPQSSLGPSADAGFQRF